MYSTAVGLVLHGKDMLERPNAGRTSMSQIGRAGHRMVEWLREFF
jgi:hypothetical protein